MIDKVGTYQPKKPKEEPKPVQMVRRGRKSDG